MIMSSVTQLCGLIGDPVEHSLSPPMHNVAFRALRLDYVYLPFRVKKAELSQAIGGMRALNIRGLNVTVPHKVAVIPFLDNLDPLAKKIGAVNTIDNKDGVLTGYNTDGAGFLQALRQRGIEPQGKNVVVLGAGGAARAISFALADSGARITILNRREEFNWAEELASQLSPVSANKVKALELKGVNLAQALDKADIMVNATSVGMSPDIEETPLDSAWLRPDLIVYDIVYNPMKTRLLREAESAGAKTISGVDMLVRQGALAFEKWTGHQAPIELMKAEVVRLLEKD